MSKEASSQKRQPDQEKIERMNANEPSMRLRETRSIGMAYTRMNGIQGLMGSSAMGMDTQSPQ